MRDALDHFFSDQRSRLKKALAHGSARLHRRLIEHYRDQLGPIEMDDRGVRQPYRNFSREQQRQRSMGA